MHLFDYTLIALYLAGLLYLGLWHNKKNGDSVSNLILGGRLLTIPAFVASLVSTWYGGILGVGEFSFRYGLSNWVVFGLPYYIAAGLFAIFLAKKARESKVLTIPEELAKTYDNKTAIAGSVIIYLMTVPAAYILMLGILGQFLFHWPFWLGVTLGTLFSIIYVYMGGFRSVVRTDILQFILMFLGFFILLVSVYFSYGGMEFIESSIPKSHLSWQGDNTGWYIATWYFIALATLIEPAFYQRCYAAKTPTVAKKGIFISIIFWIIFDFMTTVCGLYARAILPDLSDPLGAYPALAIQVLPIGLMGIFALSLLSTVMSTIDSYSFLAASTFGNDIAGRLFKLKDKDIIIYTRFGLVISATLAVLLAIFFKSVVDIWHAFGSIGTPALLVPVFFSIVGKRRMSPNVAFGSIMSSGSISTIWYISKYFTADKSYWLGLEPILPGLALSLILFLVTSKKTK